MTDPNAAPTQSDAPQDPRLAAARVYIRLGWKIFVLGADKNPVGNCQHCPKHGAADDTGQRHDAEQCTCLMCHGFYAATGDLARVEEMLRRRPDGQLAVRTGVASGIVVIDGEGYADSETLPTGVAVLDDWESWVSTAEHDGWSLPYTLAQRTPSGGLHMVYALPPGLIIKGRVRVLPGVDIKAEGGYVAVAPSAGREWIEHPIEDLSTDLMAAPIQPMVDWLMTARGRGRGRHQQSGDAASDSGGNGNGGNGGAAASVRGNGTYDFEYCREHGAPIGMRDEYINEFFFRLRRSGVPRTMAEAAARSAFDKMEQRIGNEFTWDMVIEKCDHVYTTVQTEAEERTQRATGERLAQRDLPPPPLARPDVRMNGSFGHDGAAPVASASIPVSSNPYDERSAELASAPLIAAPVVAPLGDVTPDIIERHGLDHRGTPVAHQATSITDRYIDPELGRITARDYSATDPHINTDRVNGEELAAYLDGRVLFVGSDKNKVWLVYNGQRWVEDSTGTIRLMACEYIDLLRRQAQSGTVTDEEGEMLMARAKHLEMTRHMSSAINGYMAPLLARDIETMDANPWLLNCLNGTIDLRTGELRPHNSLDLITRICPTEYDPDSRDETWERVLREALGGDDEKIKLFVRYAGYTLTGDTREKCLLVAHGITDTGKSTVTEPIYRMLGDVAEGGYATVWGADVVQSGTTANRNEKLSKSRAARMILVGELEEDAKMADGFVKNYTGGDTMDARSLYRDSYSFRPQGKLWLATNFIPKSTDRAVHNRMKLLPFNHVPTRKDPRVKAYLDNDPRAHKAILAWAVKACLKWQAEGSLGTASWMKDTMREYALDSDPILQFMETYVVPIVEDPHLDGWEPPLGALAVEDVFFHSVTTTTLHRLYLAWCGQNGVREPLSARAFKRLLETRHGWTAKRSARNGAYSTVWIGYATRAAEE